MPVEGRNMPRKSMHKAKTRAKIIDETAKALRVHGIDGVSVSQLMSRAGLTHGGFYAHFQSKDDLVVHAIDYMLEDCGRMLDRFLGDAPGAKGLAALIDYYLSERIVLAIDSGCPLPSLASEVSRMPKAAWIRFEQGICDFRDAVGAALESMGINNSKIRAASVLSELVGSVNLARAMREQPAAIKFLDAAKASLKQGLCLV